VPLYLDFDKLEEIEVKQVNFGADLWLHTSLQKEANMIGRIPHHLGIGPSDARCAIITGDPSRVAVISTLLDNSHKLSDNRGYICYQASIGALPVIVVSTGIGGPSTAIVVEELVEIGIQVIVRIGTCGALQHNVKVGDLVIPTGCVREDGTTAQYIEQTFPSIPDFKVLNRLIIAAKKQQICTHVGITHCKDAYYLEQPGKQLLPHTTKKRWEIWQKAGVLATEMETSTLFILGNLRKIRTGGIFINVGKVTKKETFHHSLEKATRIVSDALVSLIDELGLKENQPEPIDDSSYLDLDQSRKHN
jgi:uridine phosphorylase